jgi:Integrase core domain
VAALDNAVIEAWHSTLEPELRSVEYFPTKAAARARIPTWIDDYNTNRRHSALRKISPTRQAGYCWPFWSGDQIASSCLNSSKSWRRAVCSVARSS